MLTKTPCRVIMIKYDLIYGKAFDFSCWEYRCRQDHPH